MRLRTVGIQILLLLVSGNFFPLIAAEPPTEIPFKLYCIPGTTFTQVERQQSKLLLEATQSCMWLEGPRDKRFTYNFFERFGGYYGGTLNEFRVRANYRPTSKFSISTAETWDRFRLRLPHGNFSVVLASLQGNYSFNRFLTFTSLIQVDT